VISADSPGVTIRYVTAQGPGGQNVNKVATAAQLRFDVLNSPDLPDAVKVRLIRLGGQRMTQEGLLLITAQRFRSQERNREDALARLNGLIEQAHEVPKPRRPSKPGRAAKARRMDSKTKRGAIKRFRGSRREEDH
jgi:ribosome-associated protein